MNLRAYLAPVAGSFGLFLTGVSASAQTFYIASKTQNYLQTGSGTPTAYSLQPFHFGVQSAVAATLNLPNATTQPLTFSASNAEYEINATFTNKTALDATYPNGIYRLTGSGVPNVTWTLTPDSYPAATPQITNGTWTPGGVLVVNPAQSTTLNFSAFSDYATVGSAAHMEFNLTGISDNVSIDDQIVNRPGFGIISQATPLTSETIPANKLISGHLYQVELADDAVITADLTSVPGAGVVSSFQKHTVFFVAALPAGTTVPAPVINTQPTDVTAAAGGQARFNLAFTVGGATPTDPNAFNVTWTFNGNDINPNGGKYVYSGASLIVNNVTSADAGTYAARIVNGGGVVISNTANLVAGPPAALSFSVLPTSQTIAAGSSVVFNSLATGATSYQWQRNGTPLPGATNATLYIPNASAANAGTYTVVAANGTVPVSATATLVVNTTAAANVGRLTNLSVRTVSGSGDQVLNVGFAIGGAGTSGSKPLLVRVSGPTLATFGVSGTMTDPTLTILPLGQTTVVGSNDNWGGDATVRTTAAAVGAFPFTADTSTDAATVVTLSAGTYTALAAGKAGGTGAVLTEIYDATTSASITATTPRLTNVSARAQVNTGQNILIAGFAITGNTAKTLLIRATGPALATFGVSGTLADPKLEIYPLGGAKIYENDNWGGSSVVSSVSDSVGAFKLTDANSKDAALLITLPPGAYTAQVSGIGDTTGVALVEVYDVP